MLNIYDILDIMTSGSILQEAISKYGQTSQKNKNNNQFVLDDEDIIDAEFIEDKMAKLSQPSKNDNDIEKAQQDEIINDENDEDLINNTDMNNIENVKSYDNKIEDIADEVEDIDFNSDQEDEPEPFSTEENPYVDDEEESQENTASADEKLPKENKESPESEIDSDNSINEPTSPKDEPEPFSTEYSVQSQNQNTNDNDIAIDDDFDGDYDNELPKNNNTSQQQNINQSQVQMPQQQVPQMIQQPMQPQMQQIPVAQTPVQQPIVMAQPQQQMIQQPIAQVPIQQPVMIAQPQVQQVPIQQPTFTPIGQSNNIINPNDLQQQSVSSMNQQPNMNDTVIPSQNSNINNTDSNTQNMDNNINLSDDNNEIDSDGDVDDLTQDINQNDQSNIDSQNIESDSMNSGNTENEELPNVDTEILNKEKDLFADLSPAQLNIKKTELMQNYINLYNTINTTFENVNKIPKTDNNLKVIEFITDKLVNLKDYVNQIITVSYVTKTYIENLENFKQCLLLLSQLDTMLKGLVPKHNSEKDKK